jgi:hypothetical protein
VSVNAQGVASASITRPGNYQVFANVSLQTTLSTSSSFLIGTTGCGLSASFDVTSQPAPPVNATFSFFGFLPPVTRATVTYNLAAVPGSRTTLSGVNTYLDYTLRNSSGTTLGTYRLPLSQVTVTQTATSCHNSGGS